jgi:hypothetical protein
VCNTSCAGCGIALESDRHCRPPPSGDDRMIFSMGFPADLVRRALRRTGDNEARAIEMLLQGDDGGEEEDGSSSGVPAEWSGSHSDFASVMHRTMEIYTSW